MYDAMLSGEAGKGHSPCPSLHWQKFRQSLLYPRKVLSAFEARINSLACSIEGNGAMSAWSIYISHHDGLSYLRAHTEMPDS